MTPGPILHAIGVAVALLAALIDLGGCADRNAHISPGEGRVAVPGGNVWYRVVGGGKGIPLIVLHGGPGLPSHYLERLSRLGDERPVIFYDQLGCGRSDRPTDTNLWRLERFVAELAEVRRALGLKEVHLLGHSWGTQLAVEYMLTRPRGVQSLVLSSPCLSIPRWTRDAQRLFATLPPDVQQTLRRHERAGTTQSDEYQTTVIEYYKLYVCRMEPPAEMQQALEGMGHEVYEFMWGPSEFTATGTLKDYDCTARLAELTLPVLFTCGRYDEATPEATAYYQDLVPGAQLVVFENSAHQAMLEETERYEEVLRAFLREHDRR